jgi:hypothetical protein
MIGKENGQLMALGTAYGDTKGRHCDLMTDNESQEMGARGRDT